MVTGSKYVHKFIQPIIDQWTMVKFLGGVLNFFIFCKFLKILMVSDKTIHKAFRIHKTLQTKPIKDFFFSLTIYIHVPKLHFGFLKSSIAIILTCDILCLQK